MEVDKIVNGQISSDDEVDRGDPCSTSYILISSASKGRMIILESLVCLFQAGR